MNDAPERLPNSIDLRNGIADEVSRRRKLSQLSLVELAERVGIDEYWMSDLENDDAELETNLSLDAITKLCAAVSWDFVEMLNFLLNDGAQSPIADVTLHQLAEKLREKIILVHGKLIADIAELDYHFEPFLNSPNDALKLFNLDYFLQICRYVDVDPRRVRMTIKM